MINIKNNCINYKRDIILQKIGVIHYKLYRINLLKGLANFDVSSYIKLVIITHDVIDFNRPFIKDILYALHVQRYQVFISRPEQFKIIMDKLTCPFWLIGNNMNIKNKKLLDKKRILRSSSLLELANNKKEKRLFWKQIYNCYT
ncbi:DNA polymerase III subunit psi [Candidatus Pantoea edessiphila]|uniref:DNA polymerase III subunit psi n=1 Tax=Candidatus Pantoea edessiphila TaxID=2044610 RepID=UPI001319C443|nr:DNA polymerase III subunit psi [Candidatus Pantoea edessiphila]